MLVKLALKAIPQSGKQALVRDKSGIIKCFLKSPPEKGKANDELIKFLSKQLQIPSHYISIMHGETDRKKILLIQTNDSFETMLEKLGIPEQKVL